MFWKPEIEVLFNWIFWGRVHKLKSERELLQDERERERELAVARCHCPPERELLQDVIAHQQSHSHMSWF